MANSNGWGDGASNNDIGWGQGADNAIGWGAIYADSWAGATDIVGTPAVDPDAQAFITAASITDPTQQRAINQLVVDLKGYGVWSKMKALYPFVGGTAAQHKWNLKDPRDLDAAFRLVFSGGWTHSSTGATPNGTNAFADTKLLASTQLSLNSTHISVYSRTNTDILAPSIANATGAVNNESSLWLRATNLSYLRVNTPTASTQSTTDSRGTFIGNRNSSTQQQLMVRGTRYDFSVNSNSLNSTTNYSLSGLNGNIFWDTKQLAFASIGDGLTNQNMTDLTTAVQAFQTTLGRSIGTQTVSDADAQAFVTNAGIVDQVEANAINNLVIGLKADSLWTKMKACYPMVGGSSSTMKYNLKNPLDTDAAFRLVFSGGWTFSQTGALPNGTNAFADTYLNPFLNLTNNNYHFSHYSRTQKTTGTESDIACTVAPQMVGLNQYYSGSGKGFVAGDYNTSYIVFNDTNTLGLLVGSRTSQTSAKMFMNNVQIGSTLTLSNPNALPNRVMVISGNRSTSNIVVEYSSKQCAFASIGDGLTDTDVTNLNTRVTTFQTALNRNV